MIVMIIIHQNQNLSTYIMYTSTIGQSTVYLSSLYHVSDPLEDVGHLSHDPQSLLHQRQQLLVLLSSGTLLVRFYILQLRKQLQQQQALVTESVSPFLFYLIRVVIEHERLLIALDGDGIFLTTVPPICHSHAALAHLSPLKIRKNTVYILIWKS